MSCKTLVVMSAVLLSTYAWAEGTRTWEQSKFEELIKGTATGIALRSEGGLELAPAFKAVATTASTYIWSIASDAAGNVYAAAGSPARVYRVAPDGQIATIFEPQELQVQALVVEKSGIVYAATSPDGKVYRLEQAGRLRGARRRISIRIRNISGGWFWTAREICMLRRGTMARSTRLRREDSIRFFSRAMKFTCECWRLIPKGI